MNKFNLLLIILFFFVTETNSIEKNVFIKKIVNNYIITNIDIENEVNLLKTMNPNLVNVKEEKLIKYAEDSLVNEKIKISELSLIYDVNTNENLPEEVLLSYIKKLNINNISDFKNYLISNNINYEKVIEKLYIEHLWNVLIYNKYKNQINVDEKKIKENLLKEIKSEKKKYNYLLYEIIYRIRNKDEEKTKYKELINSIEKIGFESTANLYSVSDTAKFSGKVGWIHEDQLSKTIKKEIVNTSVGNTTSPIKITDGYMLLLVKEIKEEDKEVDFNQKLKKLIDYERNNQLQKFSRQYYNKIALNQTIE